MLRPSLRKSNQMRPVSMETGVNKWAEGSCLIKVGHRILILLDYTLVQKQ